MRGHIGTVAALVFVTALAPAALMAQVGSEEELAQLRAEIGRLERELDSQISRRDDGMAELRGIEGSLAATRAELGSLAERIETQSERQDRIAMERGKVRQRLGDEQAALAEQIRMSYMTGRQELIKLLLSQQRPADFGRMLVYYDYLNRHRSERITAVDAELIRLAELAVESEAVARELERLRSEQEAEAERLGREQAQRQALIGELNAAIESAGSRIERMREDEAHLNEVIARLAEVLEGFPVSSDAPFSEQQGGLRWPIDGRRVAEFGDYRDTAGRVRWSGVLIEADAGIVVRAIYHGRVIHSQWTPGMGLLLILDHGEGFWSLYGHNAALLREAGNWVSPGDAIAEVGDTGGQLGTGLYFGIRRHGEPIDPADWIR